VLENPLYQRERQIPRESEVTHRVSELGLPDDDVVSCCRSDDRCPFPPPRGLYHT
jgi:hypothetical protein